MSSYFYYLTNDNGTKKIGMVDDSDANYTGDATVFYSKLEEVDTTTDANEPTIDERWHWAIVYGAMWLMGIPGISEHGYTMYKQYLADAKSSGRKVGTLATWNY